MVFLEMEVVGVVVQLGVLSGIQFSSSHQFCSEFWSYLLLSTSMSFHRRSPKHQIVCV